MGSIAHAITIQLVEPPGLWKGWKSVLKKDLYYNVVCILDAEMEEVREMEEVTECLTLPTKMFINKRNDPQPMEIAA